MTPRIEVIYKIHDAWRASLEQELKTARATARSSPSASIRCAWTSERVRDGC